MTQPIPIPHRILNGTITAHDIRDLEKLVRSVIDRMGARHLTADEYDDAFAYLIVKAWEHAERYDPARPRPHPTNPNRKTNYTTLCVRLTRYRYIDWYRARYGGRHTAKPETVPLDTTCDGDATLQLAAAHPTSTSDPQTDSDPDLERVLHQGDSGDAELLGRQGRPAPRRTTGRAGRTARAA